MARATSKQSKRKATRRVRGESLHRGKTASERRAERRERLLATGLELFGTIGYGETTIEGICAHAHVTARHFYEEFDSRESLLLAVYDRVVAQSLGAVSFALDSAPPDEPLDRVSKALRSFVDTLLDDPRKAHVQCVQIVGVSATLETHRRRVLRTFANLVEREAQGFADRGFMPHRPFHIAAMALVAGVNELVIESLADPKRFPKEAIIDESVALIMGGAQIPPSKATARLT